MILSRIIFLFIFLFSQSAFSAGIIRDSEIEEAIWLVVDPVVKASHLKDLKIHILNDPIPNAFTIGGVDIFIHSGLITQFPNPDILRGIIAHEIGHIMGQHIARSQQVIGNYSNFAIGGAALGLAAAMATGNINAALAGAIGGAHVADRSIAAYSRTFESSADQTSLRLLETSGNSAIGLIEFFDKSRLNLRSPDFANPYDRTHPMDQDRLRVIKNFHAKSKYQKSTTSPEVLYKYTRSAAKLAAYTLGVSQSINIPAPKEYKTEIDDYVQSIKDFRSGRLKEAINTLDRLLSLRPNDPYYHELKGQILFEFDSNLALIESEKAVALRPNDKLLRLARGVIGITNYLNTPSKMEPFYQDLLSVAKNEPDNLLALYYLAIYYEKQGMTGKSYLNSATIAYKTGNLKGALNMAKAALTQLKPNSPDWYKASDMVQMTSNMQKDGRGNNE